RRVLAAVTPLAADEVPLEAALGRALAGPLTARATLPPWDNSAMDGYAVRAVDVREATPESPVRLTVTGGIRAGELPEQRAVEPGHAVRIMTGAPLPAGADSVIRVEDTDGERGTAGVVEVRASRDAGRHVRPGGQDMEAGEVVLPEGTSLTPGAVAVVAALGYARVPVVRRPRVAVMSSGDELRTPADFDDVVSGRGIPETNGPALLAGLAACGAEPVALGVARDEEEDIRSRVRSGLGADLLVTSGGASMGEADLVKRVLEGMGLEVGFWRVRIRPGSPFGLARLPRPDAPSGLPVLSLPGNPASAFVTFQLFVRPAVLRLGGHRRVHRRVVTATAGEPLRSTPRLTHFHRVVLEGEPDTPTVRLTGPTGSGLVRSLGLADGLAVVPEGRASVEAGEPVDVILLDDGPGSRESPGYR
ncbi:MAG TPA: gephyrin-like molybdotransferase Glp, partial [Longimicrobiales bacterium]|nr:gephyrin-like molybdotransferase Glp [Longimicrobiales bacterium]